MTKLLNIYQTNFEKIKSYKIKKKKNFNKYKQTNNEKFISEIVRSFFIK